MKRATVLLLIVLQCQGSFAAIPAEPPSGAFQRIGILRIGTLSATQAEVYPILTKNIQRWMENRNDLRVIAKPLGGAVSSDEWKAAATEVEVSQLLRKVPDMETEDEVVRRLEPLRDRLSRLPQGAPLVQKLLAAEGLWKWKHGKKDAAARDIKSAIKLHPIGELAIDWEESDAAFQALVAQLTSQTVRSCVLVLNTNPPTAQVKVNGFSLSPTEYRSLIAGRLYRISVEAPGFEARDELVSCQRSQRVNANISLKKGTTFQGVAQLSRARDLDAILFIKPERDNFRLFLYSQDRAFDEIPLEAPLTVAELSQKRAEATVPIASDAAAALFEKHRVQLAPDLSYTSNRSDVEGSLKLSERRGDEWYNDWRVWAIAGGLIAGGVTAFLMSRKGGSVSSQHRIGVKIE